MEYQQVHKQHFAIGALIIGALAVAACGETVSSPDALKVTLQAEDVKWDTPTINANVGQPVEVAIANKGALDHNFSVDEFGVSKSVTFGASASVTFTPTTAGEFEFYCNRAGHHVPGWLGG